MTPAPDELVGAWELETFGDPAGPLGPRPAGFLLYLPDGYLSVSMMRASPGEPRFMGYAGRWRIEGDRLVHRIVVSSRADWVGTEQERVAELDGDRLHITTAGPRRRRVVVWRRENGELRGKGTRDVEFGR
ncbi:Lipocalin-like domain-containing protein [Amycolatopsis pretoriensis]|uniref:Lipocalin-like domain-containing protein n=1 Tax=Amycolatopsis pretoriensis TaxID=218821 RepID=A0A1H5QK94_9PSEU|nr:lipocalin-like domain-containing protein [Amycolatopsis pretoriensis]SEF26540.1 Lipocalin-like domain-containing protein [Amycolatopsis pretoriensis]